MYPSASFSSFAQTRRSQIPHQPSFCFSPQNNYRLHPQPSISQFPTQHQQPPNQFAQYPHAGQQRAASVVPQNRRPLPPTNPFEKYWTPAPPQPLAEQPYVSSFFTKKKAAAREASSRILHKHLSELEPPPPPPPPVNPQEEAAHIASLLKAYNKKAAKPDPNEIPSVLDSASSRYLRDRKKARAEHAVAVFERELEANRTPMDRCDQQLAQIESILNNNGFSSLGQQQYQNGGRRNSSSYQHVGRGQQPLQQQPPPFSEFQNRLFMAHNTVDDLLKRRGINRNFREERELLMRQYEDILIRERMIIGEEEEEGEEHESEQNTTMSVGRSYDLSPEFVQRRRSSSLSSASSDVTDSGLSADFDNSLGNNICDEEHPPDDNRWLKTSTFRDAAPPSFSVVDKDEEAFTKTDVKLKNNDDAKEFTACCFLITGSVFAKAVPLTMRWRKALSKPRKKYVTTATEEAFEEVHFELKNDTDENKFWKTKKVLRPKTAKVCLKADPLTVVVKLTRRKSNVVVETNESFELPPMPLENAVIRIKVPMRSDIKGTSLKVLVKNNKKVVKENGKNCVEPVVLPPKAVISPVSEVKISKHFQQKQSEHLKICVCLRHDVCSKVSKLIYLVKSMNKKTTNQEEVVTKNVEKSEHFERKEETETTRISLKQYRSFKISKKVKLLLTLSKEDKENTQPKLHRPICSDEKEDAAITEKKEHCRSRQRDETKDANISLASSKCKQTSKNINTSSIDKAYAEKGEEPNTSNIQIEKILSKENAAVNISTKNIEKQEQFRRLNGYHLKANISLQHCSFSQISKNIIQKTCPQNAVEKEDKFAEENNVRIHFRLTMPFVETAETNFVFPIRKQTRKTAQNFSEPINQKNDGFCSKNDKDATNLTMLTDDKFFRVEEWKRIKAENICKIRSVRDNLKRAIHMTGKHGEHPTSSFKSKKGKVVGSQTLATQQKSHHVRENPQGNVNSRKYGCKKMTTAKSKHNKLAKKGCQSDDDNERQNEDVTKKFEKIVATFDNDAWKTPKHWLQGYRKWWEEMSDDEVSEWDQRLLELWWEDVRRRLNIPVPQAIIRPIFCFECCFCNRFELPDAEWPRFLRFACPEQFEIPIDDWCIEELIRLQKMILERIGRNKISYNDKEGPNCFASAISPLFIRHRNSLKKVNLHQNRPPHRSPSHHRKKRWPKWVPKWRRLYRCEYEEEEVEDVEEPAPQAAEEAAPPPPAAAAPAKKAPEPEPPAAAEEEEDDDEEQQVSVEKKGESEIIEAPKLKKAPPPAPKDFEPAEMTEAEAAMLAAKKRHEEELAAKAEESDERRRQELAAVENELVELKQRQAERKEQRAKEEAEFAERRRGEEERRRAEEEERKNKMESEKRRKQEERRNRQLQMAGAFAGVALTDGELSKNFVLPEKGTGGLNDQQDGLAAPKPGRMSREQHEEAKKNYMSIVNKPIDVTKLGTADLKIKIKQLYARIVKLEGDKYDLEKRKDRQDYDIKELDARRQQEARNKALKMGLNEEEMQREAGGKHPPKVLVASRFDRVVDRRGYGDKRELFENPFVKPNPSIVHGSGRPPPEWGRKEIDELEQIRKNLEPPKYVEQVKAEGEMAKPPVPIIPMQVPATDFDDSKPEVNEELEQISAPPEPPKKGRAVKA